jgi:hypothetical protein
MIRSEGFHNPGTDMAPVNFQLRAMELVRDEIDRIHTTIDGHKVDGAVPPVYELYVVWFAKVLNNWKALISTDMLDGAYYEVTHNGDKQETYIDVYGKRRNIVVPD